MEAVGKAIRARREELGLSQEAAARLAGVAKSTLRNIETDRVEAARTWWLIERAYGWAPGSWARIQAGEDPLELLPTDVLKAIIRQLVSPEIGTAAERYAVQYRQIMRALVEQSRAEMDADGRSAIQDIVLLINTRGTYSDVKAVEATFAKLGWSYSPQAAVEPSQPHDVTAEDSATFSESAQVTVVPEHMVVRGSAPAMLAPIATPGKLITESRDPETGHGIKVISGGSPEDDRYVITVEIPVSPEDFKQLAAVHIRAIAKEVAEQGERLIEYFLHTDQAIERVRREVEQMGIDLRKYEDVPRKTEKTPESDLG